MEELKKYIRNIPDFPRKGILFRDITPLLNNPSALRKAVELMITPFQKKDIEKVVAVESRGFILGGIIAYLLRAGLVPVRKKGKLPYSTISAEYDLEYGRDILEMHEDALKEGENVLIVDDLLATGGTVSATIELVEKKKAKIIGVTFLIELTELNGRSRLKEYSLYSLIKY